MEISLLKALLENISSVLHLSCEDNRFCEIVEKYYIRIEQVLKLIKPILESVVDADVASDQLLERDFAGMSHSVDELRKVLEDCHPLMSKVYFVLKIDSLVAKVQTHGLDLLDLLQSCEGLPLGLSSTSLEHCMQKMKQMGYEKPSAIVFEAIKDQVEGTQPSPGIRSKVADLLSLKSNQELLIELVALENLKENAEQLEKIRDVEYIQEMVNLVTYMHDCFIETKQSQNGNVVPIPPDFCCPLSLELMTDPVIVASGQTYERERIRSWIDLGLTVCPNTMQTLAHTSLIPNYTVKALIASWCDSNNVKLPESGKNLILSSGSHQEEYSLEHHVRSSSEDSMPGKESSAGSGVDNGSPEISHNLNEESSLQEVTGTTSDAAGEVAAEAQPAVAATVSNQHEYSPRFRNRSRSKMWHRSTERFGPRVVPSVTETRPDLIEVEAQVIKLVEDLSSTSLDTVKNATYELRLLARHDKDIRNVIANRGAITPLISLLHSPDNNIQENAVTALLNLSINDVNKTAIGNSGPFESLIHVLQTGSSEARENSAATLFSLSLTEENKIRIGRSGAIGPLVNLLGDGTPRGKKDAATALFNLSTFHENKARIVQEGAVRFLVELMDPAVGMFDKAVAVLSNLSTIPEGRSKIGQQGAIPMLVEVLELGSARGKENAAAALVQLCTNSNRFCNMVLQAGAIPPLAALSRTGTPRAKEKAQSLLRYFRTQRHSDGGRT